jgi:hypothetical protein
MPDADREELAWQDALAKAAIDKEKIDRKIVAKERGNAEGKESVQSPFAPPDNRQSATRMNPVEPKEIDPRPTGWPGRPQLAAKEIHTGRFASKSGRAAGKALDTIANMLDALIAPQLTPDQKRDGERAAQRREVEASQQIDVSKYTSQIAHQRQQQEQEREAQRQREKDDRER